MRVERGASVERLAAVVAFVRFFLPREKDILTDSASADENSGCFTWNGAGCTRRAYLRVDDFVSAESAGLAEAFPAHFTHEGSGPGVHRHVSGQVVVRVKNLQRERERRGGEQQ